MDGPVLPIYIYGPEGSVPYYPREYKIHYFKSYKVTWSRVYLYNDQMSKGIWSNSLTWQI